MTNLIDQATVKEWFHYESGKLFWKKRPLYSKVYAGDEAGCILKSKHNKTFYRIVKFRKIIYKVHNLIWILHYEFIPQGFEPDHIDHNGLNNLINNLRLVKHIENQHNISKSKSNTSGITGVYYSIPDKKWRARIGVKSKYISLGSFKNLSDAARARKKAELKYGFHKNHGREVKQ